MYATKRQQFPPITPSTEHSHLTWNKPFKEAVITAITRAVSGKRKQKLRHPGMVVAGNREEISFVPAAWPREPLLATST